MLNATANAKMLLHGDDTCGKTSVLSAVAGGPGG